MKNRNCIPIWNRLASPLRVVIEPWADEMTLAPGEQGEVIVTGPSECPPFSIKLCDYGFIVYIEGDSDGYELWRSGERISCD